MIRLFRVFIPARVLVLFLLDLALITSCFLIASLIYFEAFALSLFLFDERGLVRISVVAVSILLGIYFQDLYFRVRVRSRLLLLQQLCQIIGIAFILQSVLAYINPEWIVPRYIMVVGSILTLVSLILWRMFYSVFMWGGFGSERLLFLGTSSVVQEIAERIQHRPDLGFSVIGYVDDEHEQGSVLKGSKVLGPVHALPDIVKKTKPDRMILGIPDWRRGLPFTMLLDLRFSGTVIEDAVRIYEAVCGRFCISQLRPSQLIFSNELGSRPGSLALQSIYNNVIGLAGVVVSAPVMVLIAAAVKLSSPGPAMFSQERVGFNGIPFTLLRFRCNYVNLETRKQTPLGRWLRKYHLDALPQIFNLVRGEMSLVGPSPERPEFVKILREMIPYYPQRHLVKPGITGWSQINRARSDSIEDTITGLEYDLYYIKNISLLLDAHIILRTLKAKFVSRSIA